jgi:hypothetical protein
VKEFLQFAAAHKAAVIVAWGWLVHVGHLAWPRITAIYPYARENGGVFGIASEFLFGKKKPQPEPVKLNENTPA